MNWRRRTLNDYESQILRTYESLSREENPFLTTDQLLLVTVAKRLDAAENLLTVLEREIGFQLNGNELRLKEEAFGAKKQD